jgi:APA family basic amino acid/polyamine antiporter
MFKSNLKNFSKPGNKNKHANYLSNQLLKMRSTSSYFYRKIINRAFLLKPLNQFQKENFEQSENGHTLERNMSLFDLLCLGIGGTVGSGVFVLSGLIANEYAGPATILSFLIAGIACLFSALSYGELSCRIPSAGSSYAYVYAFLGEYLAVVAASSLCFEYGIASSAVAR